MHKKKVVDLQNYRDAETEQPEVFDEGATHLRAGTALLFGQYTLLGYINCGGFGITYLAEDSLGRKVAVKECYPGELCYRSGNEMRPRSSSFKAELDAIVDHFIKEAQRLASLKHDNIVHVHQVFEENATAYIVMDYVDGPDLLDIAESEEASLDPEIVEALTAKMLHAIAYVHSRGILHRDISPDNILVRKTGEPVLIDFGAAQKASERSAHLPSRLKFVKDGYSPQEFYIPGREQGPSSDLYSFAASLHHVIAGYPPEDGQKRLAALAANEPDPYLPLTGRIEGYSPGFLKAIDKALECLPANRIQSAEDWHAMLVGGKPPGRKRKSTRPLTERSGLMALPIENFAARWIERTAKKRHLILGGALAAGLALAGVLVLTVLAPFGEPDTRLAATPAPVTLPEPVETATGETALAGLPEPVVAPEREVVSLAANLLTPDVDGFSLAETLPIETASVSHQAKIEALGLVPLADASPAVVPEFDGAPDFAALSALPAMRAAFNAAPLVSGKSPVAAELPEFDASVALVLETSKSAVTPDWTRLVPVPKLGHAAPGQVPSELAPLPRIVLTSFAPGLGIPSDADALALDFAPLADVLETVALPSLPRAEGELAFNGDVEPPAYAPVAGTVVARQVVFSHWDLDMPFESAVARVRNSNTETITGVASGADLAVSGAWIKDGVVIYSFNGERLEPETPISTHALNVLAIDPDGYMRASVRYRDPETGRIDRGLLAIPVVREIGLADGTRLEARAVDLTWVLTVTETAARSDFRPGDQLRVERTLGAQIQSHEALAEALDALVARGDDQAVFSVRRDGQDIDVVWHLARET